MSRAIVLLALSAVVLGCDPGPQGGDGGTDGGGGGQPRSDAGDDGGQSADAPTVTALSPAGGSAIGPGDTLTVIFSEPMAEASLTLGGTLGDAANASWSAPTSLVLTPVSAWPASSTLSDAQTLTISATSLAGVAMAAPASFSYVVDAAAPEVSSTTPSDGAALGPTAGILIHFDESVAPASLGALGGTLAASVGSASFSQTSVPNDTLLLTPSTTWPDGLAQTVIVPAGLSDARGNARGVISLTFDVDGVAPSLIAAVPADGTLIAWDDGLQLTFDEPLAGGSAVRGTLVASGYTAEVSGATLTVTPNGTWNAGSDRVFEITVEDAAGNTRDIALTFDVLDDAIYVHTAGADGNPGTRTEPKRTIAAALTSASGNGIGEVRVAEGTYNENLVVPAGVRLLGGYSAADWTAAPSRTAFPTVITEPRTGVTFPYTVDLSPDSSLERFKVISHASASGCSPVRLLQNTTGTQRVIDNELEARACGEVNNIRATNSLLNVEIRGNRLTSSSVTTTHYALRLSLTVGALPNIVIADNEILVSTSAALSRGVMLTPNGSHTGAGTVRLENNFIRGGSGTNPTSGTSYGCELTLNNLTYVLTGNRIYGGTGAKGSFGVYVSGTGQTTELVGNAIHGGAPTTDASDATGVQLSGQAKIWNNLISGGGRIGAGTTDGDSHALELFTAGATVINNVLHHGFLKRGAAIRNNAAGVILRNNIFLSGGAIPGGLVIAVREMNASADFAELRNNRFDGFADTGHYRFSDYDASGTGTCPGFATYDCYSAEANLNDEALTTQGAAGTADGNSVGTAGFADVDGPDDSLTTLFDAVGVVENQWWLSASSPIVTTGLDGSPAAGDFGFEHDFAGALRTGNGTTGWSIGAYETDP